MKKNLGTSILAPGMSISVAAALLALCAFTTISRADVVVINNFGSSIATLNPGGLGNNLIAQVFTVGASGGSISLLHLELAATGAGIGANANVDIYDATGGAPTGSALATGTITIPTSGNSQDITVNSLNFTLVGGSTYAIVLGPPTTGAGTVGWQWASTSDPGLPDATGTLGQAYAFDGSTWNSEGGGVFLQMNLQVSSVPEVPLTGVVMGLGALAIAIGYTLRDKLRPMVPTTV